MCLFVEASVTPCVNAGPGLFVTAAAERKPGAQDPRWTSWQKVYPVSLARGRGGSQAGSFFVLPPEQLRNSGPLPVLQPKVWCGVRRRGPGDRETESPVQTPCHTPPSSPLSLVHTQVGKDILGHLVLALGPRIPSHSSSWGDVSISKI